MVLLCLTCSSRSAIRLSNTRRARKESERGLKTHFLRLVGGATGVDWDDRVDFFAAERIRPMSKMDGVWLLRCALALVEVKAAQYSVLRHCRHRQIFPVYPRNPQPQ